MCKMYRPGGGADWLCTNQQAQGPTPDNHKQSLEASSSPQLTDEFHLSSYFSNKP